MQEFCLQKINLHKGKSAPRLRMYSTDVFCNSIKLLAVDFCYIAPQMCIFSASACKMQEKNSQLAGFGIREGRRNTIVFVIIQNVVSSHLIHTMTRSHTQILSRGLLCIYNTTEIHTWTRLNFTSLQGCLSNNC